MITKMYNGETPAQALQHSTELVQLADRLGYERYWFAEHHNTKYQMSTSPELLSAHAAALTSRINIGSGGVMLPNCHKLCPRVIIVSLIFTCL